ncbi:hypothetical protein AWM60_10045 [Micrococcus aloeverae]|nr:hypothetical protein AWM60_10045 [Micrococcus aloeverae]
MTASVQGTVSVTGEGYTTIRDSTEPRDGEMLSEAIVSRTPDTLGETAHERSTALKVLLIRCGPHA